jgi:biofilm protein TabA
MALFGSLSSLRAQAALTPALRIALDYMEECHRPGSPARQRLLAATPGEAVRIELGGGVFALEQVYRTKPRAAGRWETHVAHVDVQTIIEGEETMEIADRARLTLHEDLTPEKDLVFYAPFDGGSALRFHPGDIGIYFPADAHMGGLATGAPCLVRKTVVKVPVANSDKPSA